MNAARRAVIADLRARGMSGKEAYEATKKKEFLKQWLRVQAKRPRNEKPDGKPAPVIGSWMKKLLEVKAAVRKQIQRNGADSLQVNEQGFYRKHYIADLMKRGHSVTEAVDYWEKNKDKIWAEKLAREERQNTGGNDGNTPYA